jgi:hypothetical protein
MRHLVWQILCKQSINSADCSLQFLMELWSTFGAQSVRGGDSSALHDYKLPCC